MTVLDRILPIAILVLWAALSAPPALGQAGFREALERLDRNRDGEIDPDEITPLARPYLEQLGKSGSSRSLDLSRSNDIARIQQLSREYHANRNGATGRRVIQPETEGENTVLPLRPLPDEPLVPEFGLAEVKLPYTQDDLDFAGRTLSSHDEDKDGYIDRDEATRHRWTHRKPFLDDLNGDDRLSRMELAQRYARRRLLESNADELRQKAIRTGGDIKSSSRVEERGDESQWWRKGGNEYWLTAALMHRFDSNESGRLETNEADSLGMPIASIDTDLDGEITRDELFAYVKEVQEEAAGVSAGVPEWFEELDANRDDQVAMHEFSTEWTPEKIAEFTSYDANSDGLLTVQEVSRSSSPAINSYVSQSAELLPPKKTIISEIEVYEDYEIADLNVEISISHTNCSFLDVYLTGPGGDRIELFTSVGGSDDHFDHTILDDQSEIPITQSRPPFQGRFSPEGLQKGQPGLGHFNGKNVRGVWQLVVRGSRSDRFGMLNQWNLQVKPK